MTSVETDSLEIPARSLGSPTVQHNFREANGAADILTEFGSLTTSTSTTSSLIYLDNILTSQKKVKIFTKMEIRKYLFIIIK